MILHFYTPSIFVPTSTFIREMRVDSSEQNLGKMTLAVHRSSIIKARVEAPVPFQARGQHTQAPLFSVSIVFVLFTLYGVHICFLLEYIVVLTIDKKDGIDWHSRSLVGLSNSDLIGPNRLA